MGPPRFCTAIRIQKLVFCIKVKHKSMCAHKWWNSLRQKMTITVYLATFFYNFLEILDWGESLCGHKEQGHAHLMLTHLNLNMLIHLNPSQSWQRSRTNTVSRAVKNFGRNGPLLAGWLGNCKNIFVNLAQTCDEQMLKISERYLDSSLSYVWITENLLQQSASC